MMKREKEEIMSYEMRAKDQNVNTSKTVEVATLLDLMVALRMKLCNTNQGKTDTYMDNIDARRRIEIRTKVSNPSNQNSTVGTKATKK